MKLTKKKYSITNVFYFLIFCVFGLCSVFLIIVGTKVHSNLNNNIEQNNKMRASYNYIVNKVRSCEYASDISVENNIISINVYYDDVQYISRIYAYDGVLYEDFNTADYEFKYGSGEKIIDIGHFGVTYDSGNSQIYIDIQDGKGELLKAQVHLR